MDTRVISPSRTERFMSLSNYNFSPLARAIFHANREASCPLVRVNPASGSPSTGEDEDEEGATWGALYGVREEGLP